MNRKSLKKFADRALAVLLPILARWTRSLTTAFASGRIDGSYRTDGHVGIPEKPVKKKIAGLVLIGCLLTTTCFATPIPVQSFEKNAAGVTFKLRTGILKLQVCADRVIHVVYSPKETISQQPELVVIHKWTPVPFELKEDAASVSVSTGKIIVQVNRATGALTYLNADGKVVLQELADGGKTMTPATVNNEASFQPQQSFTSPDDEVLYGLGQAQEGIWNWRGMPRQLLQHNTDIALPVLISNKGYGLFWNNPAITQFNPADDQVQIDPATHAGHYTTKAAGDYVFFVKDGDRKNEIGVNVDGHDLGDIKNMWVPYAVAGKVNLPANKTCAVKLLGGGKNARLFARPLGNSTTFRSEVGDAIDYYFFYGPQLDDVVATFRLATGAAPLFPRWAYGFWQCRERYSSQQQILAAAAEFRRRRIPIDLIVQDWQYWGKYGWGAYKWDETKYPNPAHMIKTLHDENIKFMISVWSNPSGEVQDELKKIDALIPDKPKAPSWMDVYNPEARKIRWKYMNRAFFSIGADAWWQDATEPGDPGRYLLGHKTYFGSGNRYNNAYPLFASQASYEGQRGATSDKRVCILTRSAYPGEQRYAAAVWSGDINGDWITFKRQLACGLNLSVTGLPYWTTDCAGFFHPKDQYASPDYNELLVRWFQFSTFSPILRIHGYMTETEMWKWLPQTQDQLLAYDRLRYRLLPYAYSVAWKVTHQGYTILRPLVMDFRADPKAHLISDEFMDGPAFLVTPVTEPRATSREVYLPASTSWTNFWTGESTAGGKQITVPAPLDKLPLFIRAGSIIPFGPELQYADEKPADPMDIRVYPGADGSFTLYEDEGDNYNYEKGIYSTVDFKWNDVAKTLTVGQRQGEYPGMLKKRIFRIVYVRPGKGEGDLPSEMPDAQIHYTGEAVTVRSTG
ncbi:MAG: glycoside hydrolase family 31 protein [Planctomycetota bacterium]|nr:glycoside hydrolase family 31 protein [Planctomycetota bacterium]